jgi:hypothetical protein
VRAPFGLLPLFALLIALRFPTLLHAPTFYAEEGIVYVRYALSHDVWDSLTARHIGYYAFFSNLTGLLASLVPLSLAPYVTTVLGLVAPSLCAYLLIESGTDRRHKAVGLALIVFTLTMRTEWASSIHAQFWLATALVLMLAVVPGTRAAYAMHTIIVALAASTGAVSVLLAPVYLLGGLLLRERRLVIVGFVLGAALTLHVLAGASRTPTWGVGELVSVALFKLAVYPFVGKLADPIGQLAFVHAHEPLVFIATSLALGAWVGFVVRHTHDRWRWVAVASLSLGGACLLFALPPYEGMARAMAASRYALVGVVPVCIGLVCSRDAQSVVVQRCVSVLVVLALGSGAITGVKLTIDRLRAPSSFGDDVERFEADRGVTMMLHQPRCRVSVNAAAQREGFEVRGPFMDDAGVVFEMTLGRFDRGVPVGVFVLAARADGQASIVLTTSGFHARELLYYGDGDFTSPGRCYGGGDPSVRVAPFTWVRGHAARVRVTRAQLRTLPGDAEALFVGYGRDFADALAKGTFRRVPTAALRDVSRR